MVSFASLSFPRFRIAFLRAAALSAAVDMVLDMEEWRILGRCSVVKAVVVSKSWRDRYLSAL